MSEYEWDIVKIKRERRINFNAINYREGKTFENMNLEDMVKWGKKYGQLEDGGYMVLKEKLKTSLELWKIG